jgi:hypothetical protein
MTPSAFGIDHTIEISIKQEKNYILNMILIPPLAPVAQRVI